MSKGFQFKQFFIEHDKCAMKVGTDSIMLGSWIKVENSKHILDIGTGSGLLALMLAQKSAADCQVTGIDIDARACEQAQENALASPWSARVNIHHIPLQDYQPSNTFDLIVSNPPYFEVYGRDNESHNWDQQQRINARQTNQLSQYRLIEAVATLLSPRGRFCCILPAEVSAVIVDYALELGLHCLSKLNVQAKADGKIIRHLLEFSRYSQCMEEKNLTIYLQGNQYSQDYRTLCRDFYQNF